VYNINHSFGELQPEAFAYAGEWSGETGFLAEGESPFSEAEEMELAYELLAVNNEAEMEQFLGNLFKKAWSGIKSFGSKIIKPLGGVLKTVAKTALPFLATAAGTFFGGPAGGAIAGKLGSMVSQALEAETASTPLEDRDFEKCRQFVRMAGNAAKAAALSPPGADPIAVAKQALTYSAQEKIAKVAPAFRAEGFASQPATTTGFSPNGAATRQTTQSPRHQAMSSNTPSRATAKFADKPTGFATAQVVPKWGAGKPEVSSVQAKPMTGTAPSPGKTCGCKNPTNCTCGKCNKAGRVGRWIRQGSSIVIINC